MYDLFSTEILIKEEILLSTDQVHFHKVKMKEQFGEFPYQISIESGTNGKGHGNHSFSYQDFAEAEKSFNAYISRYIDEGFNKKIA